MVEKKLVGFVVSVLNWICQVFSVNRKTSRDVKRFRDFPKLALNLLVELGKIQGKGQVIRSSRNVE
ncbi:hypothetical protein A2U01_0055562, partial [Trifolium medium]|nr:hypothetical protein [Trifolium medium]